MNQGDVRLRLLEHLLAAPGSVLGWETFLRELCDAVHGSAASLISHEFSTRGGGISVTARTAPEALLAYQNVWHRVDPWATSAMIGSLASGSVFSGEQLIRMDEMRRTAYYSDFGRHYDIVRCIAGMIEATQRAFTCISINRGERADQFTGGDLNLLNALTPHIRRALETHRRLEGAELMNAALSSAVDRMANAIALVTASGRVVFANAEAERIFREPGGLTVSNGELRASTPTLTSRLRSAIATAVAIASGQTMNGPTSLSVPRAPGRRPLSVLVSPLPCRSLMMEREFVAVALLITDPDWHSTPAVDVLMTTLGLTHAEALLVQRLASGDSIIESARHLGITIETARTRLKAVFQKTQTHRQSELIKLTIPLSCR